MNLKQIILVFIMFFITVLVLSIPLWIDTALPILKDYLNTAMVKLKNGYAFLKFISGQVAEVFIRFFSTHNG